MFGRLKESVIRQVAWYVLRFRHHDKRSSVESFHYQAIEALMVPDFAKALACHRWCKIALLQKLKLPALSEEELRRDLEELNEVEDRIELTKSELPRRFDAQVAFLKRLVESV